ncbi:MAG: DnaJ domain-containing protein [Anaerolineae bacterium]
MVKDSSARDLYRILQVDPAAEPEVVEAAYRRLALKYHPDVSRAPDAAERMRDLNMAYSVIGDAAKRADYDRGREPLAAGAATRTRVRRQPYTPPPRLRVTPQSLQFGPLPKGSTQTATLTITMEGISSLRGSVRPNQPWLRTSVSDADGSTCSVEVTVDTATLRDGWRHAGSVTIGTIAGGSQTVPVTVIVAPEPRPAVRVEPEILDFGEVYPQAGPVARELVIRNGGTGVLSGHVEISHRWLAAQPDRLDGNEQTVTISVDPLHLKPGRRYNSRLQVETNGGVAVVPIRVRVSEIKRPLPPVDSEHYWPELIGRLLPREKWEKDLVADLALRSQLSGWRPSAQQQALVARIKARGLRE